ncbi:MAG TPA: (2Fe-2S)-binding protein [Candidatus Cloacimonadota bacterium]|nr:(2Fe-2S)-binding protein [Candidatus Cloacimonadota bacterium]HQL14606.1 (2Fe-2S)-binding protein [Candidatus Cloacimonadota bacterium]
MAKISFILNEEKRSVEVEPNQTLLDVLRDKLGVKSPKCGCDRGDCGACAVLLNGRSVRSCLILAVEVEGQEVRTLEGISQPKLTQLQENFVAMNSFQCGFCTPGVIITATELLEKNPHPDLAEIQEALSGNLCRCTGYKPIFEAILKTAKRGRS